MLIKLNLLTFRPTTSLMVSASLFSSTRVRLWCSIIFSLLLSFSASTCWSRSSMSFRQLNSTSIPDASAKDSSRSCVQRISKLNNKLCKFFVFIFKCKELPACLPQFGSAARWRSSPPPLPFSFSTPPFPRCLALCFPAPSAGAEAKGHWTNACK